jgi:all-trans-8'-apo-beta-carotenal 15,15'-oxygenase
MEISLRISVVILLLSTFCLSIGASLFNILAKLRGREAGGSHHPSSLNSNVISTPDPSFEDENKRIEKYWREGFSNCDMETFQWLDGHAPIDITGTYYRNGYGRVQVGKSEVHHPFDGDGMIVGITFNQGRMFFRNRFVRTEGFVQDSQQNQFCNPGVFGTRASKVWRKIFSRNVKNVANTNVVYWGNRLLALWEGGLPYNIDPRDLSTKGTFSYDGQSTMWTAHPKVDKAVNRLITFSMKRRLFGPSTVNIFELDENEIIFQKR